MRKDKVNIIEISGIWLLRRGKDAQVLVEINGEWRLAISELYDSNFSHIAEPIGSGNWPVVDFDDPR
ncbi:MAG: hypothetical protein AB1489_39845 [Acidobacteriota bacterium]